jgi:hypothetical protein
MSQPPSDKVTLEDLLRLKRAERPPAEFWIQFDRELQAKQLAALVGKRPWWHSAAHTFARFSSLPLGATAALAFAFMAVREYRSPVAEVTQSIKLQAPAPKLAPAPAAVRIAVLAQPAVAAVPEKAVSAAVAVATVLPTNHRSAALAAAPETSAPIAWLADTLQVTRTTPLDEHSLFVGFADARIANPRPASSLVSMGEVKTRRTADPLDQVSSPSETRHARLIAALTDVRLVSTVDPVALMHQRLATRIGDDGLADDAGRLDASGNSVSFKF